MRWHMDFGVLVYVSLLCQCSPAALGLVGGPGRCHRTQVHAAALSVGCEGQVSAGLLCLFYVNNHSPS